MVTERKRKHEMFEGNKKKNYFAESKQKCPKTETHQLNHRSKQGGVRGGEGQARSTSDKGWGGGGH
jgi:hypothetical protein